MESLTQLTPEQARNHPSFRNWFLQMESQGYNQQQIDQHFLQQIQQQQRARRLMQMNAQRQMTQSQPQAQLQQLQQQQQQQQQSQTHSNSQSQQQTPQNMGTNANANSNMQAQQLHQQQTHQQQQQTQQQPQQENPMKQTMVQSIYNAYRGRVTMEQLMQMPDSNIETLYNELLTRMQQSQNQKRNQKLTSSFVPKPFHTHTGYSSNSINYFHPTTHSHPHSHSNPPNRNFSQNSNTYCFTQTVNPAAAANQTNTSQNQQLAQSGATHRAQNPMMAAAQASQAQQQAQQAQAQAQAAQAQAAQAQAQAQAQSQQTQRQTSGPNILMTNSGPPHPMLSNERNPIEIVMVLLHQYPQIANWLQTQNYHATVTTSDTHANQFLSSLMDSQPQFSTLVEIIRQKLQQRRQAFPNQDAVTRCREVAIDNAQQNQQSQQQIQIQPTNVSTNGNADGNGNANKKKSKTESKNKPSRNGSSAVVDHDRHRDSSSGGDKHHKKKKDKHNDSSSTSSKKHKRKSSHQLDNGSKSKSKHKHKHKHKSEKKQKHKDKSRKRRKSSKKRKSEVSSSSDSDHLVDNNDYHPNAAASTSAATSKKKKRKKSRKRHSSKTKVPSESEFDYEDRSEDEYDGGSIAVAAGNVDDDYRPSGYFDMNDQPQRRSKRTKKTKKRSIRQMYDDSEYNDTLSRKSKKAKLSHNSLPSQKKGSRYLSAISPAPCEWRIENICELPFDSNSNSNSNSGSGKIVIKLKQTRHPIKEALGKLSDSNQMGDGVLSLGLLVDMLETILGKQIARNRSSLKRLAQELMIIPGVFIVVDEKDREAYRTPPYEAGNEDARFVCTEFLSTYVYPENNDNSEEYCHICNQRGEVMLCDSCPHVFHPRCVGLQCVPEGDWFCPDCIANRRLQMEQAYDVPMNDVPMNDFNAAVPIQDAFFGQQSEANVPMAQPEPEQEQVSEMKIAADAGIACNDSGKAEAQQMPSPNASLSPAGHARQAAQVAPVISETHVPVPAPISEMPEPDNEEELPPVIKDFSIGQTANQSEDESQAEQNAFEQVHVPPDQTDKAVLQITNEIAANMFIVNENANAEYEQKETQEKDAPVAEAVPAVFSYQPVLPETAVDSNEAEVSGEAQQIQQDIPAEPELNLAEPSNSNNQMNVGSDNTGDGDLNFGVNANQDHVEIGDTHPMHVFETDPALALAPAPAPADEPQQPPQQDIHEGDYVIVNTEDVAVNMSADNEVVGLPEFKKPEQTNQNEVPCQQTDEQIIAAQPEPEPEPEPQHSYMQQPLAELKPEHETEQDKPEVCTEFVSGVEAVHVDVPAPVPVPVHIAETQVQNGDAANDEPIPPMNNKTELIATRNQDTDVVGANVSVNDNEIKENNANSLNTESVNEIGNDNDHNKHETEPGNDKETNRQDTVAETEPNIAINTAENNC